MLSYVIDDLAHVKVLIEFMPAVSSLIIYRANRS